MMWFETTTQRTHSTKHILKKIFNHFEQPSLLTSALQRCSCIVHYASILGQCRPRKIKDNKYFSYIDMNIFSAYTVFALGLPYSKKKLFQGTDGNFDSFSRRNSSCFSDWKTLGIPLEPVCGR